MNEITLGTLREGEYHPMARQAMNFVQGLPIIKLITWQEALASTALSGNRTAEICYETLNRVMSGQKVSDRYIMGLYILMSSEKKPKKERKKK